MELNDMEEWKTARSRHKKRLERTSPTLDSFPVVIARYFINILQFSVFPAPDSPLTKIVWLLEVSLKDLKWKEKEKRKKIELKQQDVTIDNHKEKADFRMKN